MNKFTNYINECHLYLYFEHEYIIIHVDCWLFFLEINITQILTEAKACIYNSDSYGKELFLRELV